MPLHHTRDGYTFRADAHGLTIEPGPQPITLSRAELEQLGLTIRDDYQIPLDTEAIGPDLIDAILSALNEAVKRSYQWRARSVSEKRDQPESDPQNPLTRRPDGDT